MSAFLKRNFFVVTVLLVCVLTTVMIYQPIMAANVPADNHLVLLASRFLAGKIDLSPINLPRGDVAEFFDKRFIYFGPFPSFLLIPFVFLFGVQFPQQTIGPACLAVAFDTTFFLARKFRFSSTDALWTAIFFVFSSVLLAAGLIPISAYQVEIMANVLVLVSLLAYFYKRSPLVIGLLLAFAGMTRFPLYLGWTFFGLEFVFKRLSFRGLVLITLPVVLSLLLLGAYNFKRFRNPLESGYSYNMTHHNYPLNANLKYGLNSINYLPTNLYTLFVKGPDPILQSGGGFLLKFPYLKVSPWGLAIWFTSPLFLCLLTHLKRDTLTLSAVLASLAVALPSLTFFSIGFAQYGYRYSLDFLPFLLIVLLNSFSSKLNFSHKFLIILGSLFNLLLIPR